MYQECSKSPDGKKCFKFMKHHFIFVNLQDIPAIVAQYVAHPLVASEVIVSNLGLTRVITNYVKMIPTAAMSGARH